MALFMQYSEKCIVRHIGGFFVTTTIYEWEFSNPADTSAEHVTLCGGFTELAELNYLWPLPNRSTLVANEVSIMVVQRQ